VPEGPGDGSLFGVLLLEQERKRLLIYKSQWIFDPGPTIACTIWLPATLSLLNLVMADRYPSWDHRTVKIPT
jgi:hypothetical protein